MSLEQLESFEEFEENIYIPDTEEEKEAFVVDNDKKAEWAIKKIGYYTKVKETNKEYTKTTKDNLKAWKDKQDELCDKEIEWFEFKLAPYVAAKLKGGKKKSTDINGNTAGFRKQQNKVEIDNGALLEWVKNNCKAAYKRDERIVVDESVDIEKLKELYKLTESGALVTEDGESIPGYSEQVMPDKFYAKVNK